MKTIAYFCFAAVCEIAGCFCLWAWLRQQRSAWLLVPAVVTLGAFAYVLTRVDVAFAGRAYAAYGGIYVAASLLWLFTVEGTLPDRYDFVGAGFCLVGTAIILFAPRV